MQNGIEKGKEELDKLLKGNENFINGSLTPRNMSSRVVPEIIFDCGIGELFVIRVAGITAGPNVIESVEYAVKKLQVPLLILLGHDDCGVMKYAKEHYPVMTDDFQSIMKCVYPVLDKKEDITCHNYFAMEHTKWVEEVLLQKSKIVSDAVENSNLLIAKCHFNHDTGKVVVL